MRLKKERYLLIFGANRSRGRLRDTSGTCSLCYFIVETKNLMNKQKTLRVERFFNPTFKWKKYTRTNTISVGHCTWNFPNISASLFSIFINVYPTNRNEVTKTFYSLSRNHKDGVILLDFSLITRWLRFSSE